MQRWLLSGLPARDPEFRLKQSLLLSCCLLLAVTSAQADVRPIWSVPVGETRDDPRPLSIDDAVVLPDGSGYFTGPASGRRASLRLGFDGDPLRGHTVAPYTNRVLAVAEQRVLVVQDEVGTPFSVQLRDLRGGVLWSLERRVDGARFLADGDLIVLSQRQLLRLRGGDGAPVWTRHLVDLHAYAEDAAFELGDDVDAQVDIAGILSVRARTEFSPHEERWQAAFDPVHGDVRWALRVDPYAATPYGGCPLATDRDSLLQALTLHNGSQFLLELQRRRRSDGELLWSRRLPHQEAIWSCDVALQNSRIYLALSGSGGVRILGMDDAVAEPPWEVLLPGANTGRVLAGADGHLLTSVVSVDALGNPQTTITRRGELDGQAIWSLEALSPKLAWRGIGEQLHLAMVLDGSDSDRARVEVRDSATGALQASAEDVLTGRAASVHAAGYAGDSVCHALAALDGAVTLTCLDGSTGVARWERVLPPAMPADVVTTLAVGALAAGRISLLTGYRRVVAGAPVVLYRATAVDAATGVPAWQVPDLQEFPRLLGSDDGGAFIAHATCAAQPNCVGRQPRVDRFAGADGGLLWSRQSASVPLAENGDKLFLFNWDLLSPLVIGLDARSGGDGWTTSIVPGFPSQALGLLTPGGNLIFERDVSMGSNRRIEVRGFNASTGAERWLVTPTLPSLRTYNGVIWPLAGERVLATGLRIVSGVGTSPWLAAIDATSGAPLWERGPDLGRDSLRRVSVIGSSATQGLWVDQRRISPSDLERKAISRLDPDSGLLGGEHQYASFQSRPLTQQLEPPTPRALLADGSLLAQHWRTVDGQYLLLLERWPAPSGPDGDIAIEVESPLPAIGHGPTAAIDLRVENRSAHSVSGVRIGFIAAGSWQSGMPVSCTPASGNARCVPGVRDNGAPRMDIGPGGAVLVRYEIASQLYRPAQMSDAGNVYFHIETPFDFGDDLGNNTVVASVRLGGTSNGFE